MQKNKVAHDGKKFKDEKALIMKTLNDKNKKIEKLEKEIKDLRIKNTGLENFLGEDQKVNYIKYTKLTKNMAQLKQMYSQMVSAENAKQEKHVLVKKLKRKQAKINGYENELSNTREQVVNLKKQVHLLVKELSSNKNDKNLSKILSDDIDPSIEPGALQTIKGIVKSRKGGKGKKSSNRMSFNQLMAMSSLNGNKNNDDDQIPEQAEEDEEESLIIS